MFAKFMQSALIFGLVLVPEPSASDDSGAYQIVDGRLVAPLESFRECDHCPEMIVVPLGSFMMGAKRGESRNPFDIYGANAKLRRRGPDEVNIIPHEHPRHRVEIDIPFAVGRNEITHAEWMACVGAGGCAHVPDHWILGPNGKTFLDPNHPVINVSYLDIRDYVAWLNAQVGDEVYRLPTEAEWEYAARAGTETRFSKGDELTAMQANFSRGATEWLRKVERPDLPSRYYTMPVDSLDAANAWGLRHMSGNVRELTQSCWSAKHLELKTSSAYLLLAQSQMDCMRVTKGGSFTGAMDAARPAGRARKGETFRTDNSGFRIVRQFKVEGIE
ncbi:formylglycine-generating enzyme family protein [Arenibacterium sp. CAU 1754]